MTKRLNYKDIITLGFMIFALFVGAGNIIFPPILGLQSGQYIWFAATGFLITAVGFPIITIIAIARSGGSVYALSSPIGQRASILLAVVCYLTIGPLFAIPRTSNVSFVVGVAHLIGNGEILMFIYTLIYFALVISISLYPGRLLDTLGRVLAPLKIIALALLGIAAIMWPVGQSSLPVAADYARFPFFKGFMSGYLTMDSLGAMVFGIVIVNAARSRGVNNAQLLTRYIVFASLIAGIGLTVVYLVLFKLGSDSGQLIPNAQNGMEILLTYVQYTFGFYGSSFLAVLIIISCLVTAVGLTCACAEFFSFYLNISYRKLVFLIGLFSMAVSNLGLNHLISISMPVLTAIYPPCIVLIMLSFTLRWWNASSYLVSNCMLVSLFFSCFDILDKELDYRPIFLAWLKHLPLSEQGLVWLPPTLLMLIIAAIYDQYRGRKRFSAF